MWGPIYEKGLGAIRRNRSSSEFDCRHDDVFAVVTNAVEGALSSLERRLGRHLIKCDIVRI